MLKTIKLPSLSRVSPGAKATLELPLGPTYYAIKYTVTAAAGLAASSIGRIEALFDGKVKQTYANLQRLIDLNTYWGYTTDSVSATQIEFTVHFFRAELMDVVYRRAPGIGTADLQTFHMELSIDSGAPADIAITAEALIDPIPQPVGVFINVREYPFASSVSGKVEVDNLVKGPYYRAIHCFKADVNAVVVEINQNGDQIKVVDATKSTLEALQKSASPKARSPLSAKATHIDFNLDGDLANSLSTGKLSDFRLQMDLGTSGSMDIVTETLDTLQAA